MSYDYIKAFKKGHYYNCLVANYLNSRGIVCHAPDLKIAQNNEEIKEMTLTEKDVVLDLLDEVLEVKSATRVFSGDPLQFPNQYTIVDTVSGFRSKEKKPRAYVLVSQETKAMLAISPKSMDRWRVVHLYDKQQDLTDDFYQVKKEDLLPMETLVKFLLELQNKK